STEPSSHLPPRLRERLEKRDHREQHKGGSGMGLTLLMLLLIAAVGGFIWWRSSLARHPGTNASAVESVVDRGESFGVSVGNFPNEETALEERNRLSATTALPVTIGQVTSDGATTYRVL